MSCNSSAVLFLLFSQLFKAEWSLHVPVTLMISNSAFCIYGLCVILSVNGDYFFEQR
jgi:hypothetical protein